MNKQRELKDKFEIRLSTINTDLSPNQGRLLFLGELDANDCVQVLHFINALKGGTNLLEENYWKQFSSNK